MSVLILEIPSEKHRQEYNRIMDSWEQMEENIQPALMRRNNIPYEKWLEFCEDDRTTGSMLSTQVPCTLFFAVNEKNEIVGSIVLNHADTKRGHIHSGIVPWHRGKGYGTLMLALVLEECRRKGIKKVHICPNNKENIPAVRTILKNGGYLLDEFTDDGRLIERYEIVLE